MINNKMVVTILGILAIPLVSVYLALFSSVDVALILIVLGTVSLNVYAVTMLEIREKGEDEEHR